MKAPLASIVLPTRNGAETLPALFEALSRQDVDFPYEIVAVDSASTDGSADLLRRRADRLIPISADAFDHGLTRNLGIEHARGELVVLLVQDAVPADARWLAELTAPLRAHRNVAGSFARQRARSDASPITRYYHDRWVAAADADRTIAIANGAEFDSLQPMDRFLRCVFDNVCSCIRRSVWERHPFRPTPIAEDLEWAREIYAFEHARALRQRHGDEVLVLTREQDPGREEYSVRLEYRDGLRIAWINNTFRQTRSFEETYDNPAVDAAARRLVDEFRPDVAHIHHLTCLSTSIVQMLADRSVPTIFTLHDYWLICHRGQLLDVDYRVCEGPEPSGCHRCVGAAAGTSARAWAAAPRLRAIERALPAGGARAVRQITWHVASWTSHADEADRQARRRLEHMEQVCDKVTAFLAPSRFMRERFLRFGIAPERIAVSPYGFDHRPFRRTTRSSASSSSSLSSSSTSPRLRLGFLGSLMNGVPFSLLYQSTTRRWPSGLSDGIRISTTFCRTFIVAGSDAVANEYSISFAACVAPISDA